MHMRRACRWLAIILAALVCIGLTAADEPPETDAAARTALLIEVRDAIGPATSDFFVRALERASERKVPLLVMEMDTPGGLDSAMRDMIKAILASPVPVAIYVSPSGARAASAGTYLLYASHIAAMAPATNLGAATPVQIGATPPPEPDGDRRKERPRRQTDRAEPGTAMERKAVNDAVAYIRGLAELRGRNAEWAEDPRYAPPPVCPRRRRSNRKSSTSSPAISPTCCGRSTAASVKVSTGELTLETSDLRARARRDRLAHASCSRCSPTRTSPICSCWSASTACCSKATTPARCCRASSARSACCSRCTRSRCCR